MIENRAPGIKCRYFAAHRTRAIPWCVAPFGRARSVQQSDYYNDLWDLDL